MKQGRFITFEGIDGCGKTTQMQLLKEMLEAEGLNVAVLREPGGTKIGEQIRQVLLSKANTAMFDLTELLLFEAARTQLVHEVIAPALEQGRWIICDRFFDSTEAYQGFGRELGSDLTRRLNAIAVGDVRPDLTLWLDLTVDQAIERLAQRHEKTDRLDQENKAFMERTRQGYQAIWLREPDRVQRINAAESPDAVFAHIEAAVRALLG